MAPFYRGLNMLSWLLVVSCLCNLLIDVNGQQGLESALSSSSSSCEYQVEVKTSRRPFSGTDDVVSMEFGDAYGNQVLVPELNDPSKDSFHRGQKATFTLVGPCVKDICYLKFYRNGDDGWRVKYTQVRYGPDLARIAKFDFDSKIPSQQWFGIDLCIYNA